MTTRYTSELGFYLHDPETGHSYAIDWRGKATHDYKLLTGPEAEAFRQEIEQAAVNG